MFKFCESKLHDLYSKKGGGMFLENEFEASGGKRKISVLESMMIGDSRGSQE